MTELENETSEFGQGIISSRDETSHSYVHCPRKYQEEQRTFATSKTFISRIQK